MSPRLLFLLTVLLSGKFFFQLFLKAEALKLKKHANFVNHEKDTFVNCIDPKELADCRFINDARQFRIEADEEKEDEMEAALEELNTRLLRRFQVPKRRIVHFSGDETNMPRPLHSYQHVLLKKSYAALATVAGEEGEYRQAQMMYSNEADEEKRMAMFRARNKVENAFLVAARQGTNDAKFEPLGFYLWTGRARRVVVASSFRAAGTDGFFNYLKSMRPAGWILTEPLEYNAEIEVLKLDNEDFPERPPMEVVRWDDNDKIGRYKEWYEDDNRSVLKVLLISPMASVGVSLKRTDEIHLLEPYWSPGLEDQVIGRVIRLDSHNEDPLKPRVNFVDVVHWKGIVPRADVDRAALGPLVDNPIDYAEESLMSADERVEERARDGAGE